LLKDQQVRAIYEQWRHGPSKKSGNEVVQFAHWLEHDHYLTSYQVKQLLVGHTDHFFLSNYRVLDLVGKGRMAGIFKAAHPSGHIVAIKMMPFAKGKDPMALARFQREARMALRLKHPHIVRTYHVGHCGERQFIVMEYLEGETLEDVLKRRGKLPVAE